jgi:hypothetical protein
MDLNAQITTLVDKAVAEAVAPLAAELAALRDEVARLRQQVAPVASVGGQPVPGNPNTPPTALAPSPLPAHLQEILPNAVPPTDRSDFARMLARLEHQEQQNYSEDKLDQPEEKPKKRGWNPFSR